MNSLKSYQPVHKKSFYLSQQAQTSQDNRINHINQTNDACQYFYDMELAKNIEHYMVTIKLNQQKNILSLYQWRYSTQLPIVKTHQIKIKSRNQTKINLEIFNQYFPTRFDQFSQIPIEQALYLLKQSLIGFQRLIQKVGQFLPSSSMIAINQNKKCKVWFNDNFGLNIPKIKSSTSQYQFLQAVEQIFCKRTMKNNISEEFYTKFAQIKKFVKALKFIDEFIRENKLKVPFKFNLEKGLSKSKRSIEIKSSYSSNNRSCNYSQRDNFYKNGFTPNRCDSIKAVTSILGRMKNSNGTTKQNSLKDNIFSQLCQPQKLDDIDSQRDINLCNSQTPHKKNNKIAMFRSEINEVQSRLKNKKIQNDKCHNKSKLSDIKFKNLLEILEEKSKLKKISSHDIPSQEQDNSEYIEHPMELTNFKQKFTNLLYDNKNDIKNSILIGQQVINTTADIKLDKLDVLCKHMGVRSMIKLDPQYN